MIARTLRGLALTALLAMLAATAAAQPLTLKQARQAALANRPLVRAGDLSAQAAGRNTAQVEAARYPQLTASITAADAYRETTTQDGKEVTLDSRIAAGGLNNPTVLRRESNGLYLSQLVTDFGRTSSLIESARLSEQAQLRQAQATRAQVLLEVSEAYYAALGAQGVLAVANKTVEARRVLYDRVSVMARSKLKSELDVRFAQIGLDDARLLVLKAGNALQGAFARLSTAMGYRDARQFDLVDDPSAPSPPEDLAPLLDQAIAARPDLASLRAEREAAAKSAQAAGALRYPTINVYAAAGVTPYGDDRLSREYGAIGINLSMPLFDGGRISALEDQARLKASALAENLREAENGILRSVRLAWLDARSGFENIAITGRLREASAQALVLAETRYNLGITSIVELNQAQLSAIDSELASTRARYQYLADRAVLDYQLGAFEDPGTP
jgi:outer membrane protein